MKKAYIVGAGPGDARLLTLAAVEALQQADVVLCDRLVGFEVRDFVSKETEIIYVGKQPGEQESVQWRIFELFALFAATDLVIVRLKGGDPFVFGRGAEEFNKLVELGYDVTVVPGISSAIAVPELAGIPLTLRHVASEFAVIAGHCCEDKPVDWSKYINIDTLIILMGVKERATIAQALISSGRSAATPAAFIEKGTTVDEHVIECSLADVAADNVAVASPAVFVIGEVVRHRLACKQLFEDQKLEALELTFVDSAA